MSNVSEIKLTEQEEMPFVYLEVKIVAYDTEVNLAMQQCLTSLDSQWNKVCSTEYGA